MAAIAINSTPVSKKFNDNVIELYPDKEHEFVMTYAQVAKGFGCCEGTIRSAKKEHADELIEGKHLITSTVGNSNSRKQLQMKKVYWTKRGIVRLGFFLRSERAKQFRDWAEDLIIKQIEKPSPRKALGKGLDMPKNDKEQTIDFNPLFDQMMKQAFELQKRGGRIKLLMEEDRDIFVDTTPIYQRQFGSEIYFSKRRVDACLFSISEALKFHIATYEREKDGQIYFTRQEIMKIVNWMFDNLIFNPSTISLWMDTRRAKNTNY